MNRNLKLKIIYPLQFFLFIFIYYFLKIMPLKMASFFSGKIFKLIGPVTKVNANVINNLKNLKINPNIVNRISKQSWENLGRTIAELPHINKITNSNLISIKGVGRIKEIVEKKQQVIFIAVHQSNWEILAPVLIKFGIKINSVYRHINNSYIDKFILNLRKKAYNSKESLLSPKGKKSAQDMIKSIKLGYSIAMLIDQKDSSGINVPLFDKPAKTQTGFLKLAKKFNLKIYPIENRRKKNNKFEMFIHKPINLNSKNYKLDEKKAMIKIHKIIEGWIEKNPGSWLWQHNRWN